MSELQEARGSGLSFCMSSLIRGDARQSRAFRYFPVHFSSSLNPQDIPDSTCVAASERYWTRTHLDVFGRPVEIITADGERSALEYEGLTEIRTNPLGQRVETTRNVQGQKVTELRYPAPGEPGAAMRTDFKYDALGQLRITDGPLSGDAMARGSGLSFCISSLIRGDARQSRTFRYFPVHVSCSLNTRCPRAPAGVVFEILCHFCRIMDRRMAHEQSNDTRI